jgi:hypothetical protein
MNGRKRTDTDLSAAFYNRDFQYIDVVSYYHLKNFGGHHSGDIDAPEGAAEFIDIDIEKTISKGARYVVTVLNSFTQQPCCDLPECFAGWMARQQPDSGEIFVVSRYWCDPCSRGKRPPCMHSSLSMQRLAEKL